MLGRRSHFFSHFIIKIKYIVYNICHYFGILTLLQRMHTLEYIKFFNENLHVFI